MKIKIILFYLLANCALAWGQTATNTAPKVYVDGQADFFGSGAFLNCSSSDDGLIRPLSFQWSKVSGPGTLTWSSQQAKMTHVRFSSKGLYVIQCSVSDGQFNASDKITILVDQEADLAVRP